MSPMSESFVNPIFGERSEPATDVEVEGTGNVDVDTVIDSLGGLDDLPIGEHVAVFEQAHESLRASMAAPAGLPPVGETSQG